MKKNIYIFSSGEIHRKQNTIFFEGSGGRKFIPIENTSALYIFGEVSITKKILEYFSQTEIVVHFFNHHGYFIGSFYPREHYNSGHMTLKQAEYYLDIKKRIDLARRFAQGAVANIKKVVKYYLNRQVKIENILDSISNLEKTLEIQETSEQLMAIEGNIRDQYYKSFDKILSNSDFKWEKRTRKPPGNQLNALVSFGNSLLYVAVLSEIYKTHLDPRIGFLHTSNLRRFSLNLDLAEIFKPLVVDRVIFTLVNKKMLNPKMFEEKLSKILLNDKGKKIFIEELENRFKSTIKHKKLKRNVSYRQLILLEDYKLEKH